MNYDVDFFILKFSAIHERNFIAGCFKDKNGYCANGHCGVGEFDDLHNLCKEAEDFNQLFNILHVTPFRRKTLSYLAYKWGTSAHINDGRTNEYQQPTPKKRILAALHDIKKLQSDTILGQQPKYEDATKEILEKYSPSIKVETDLPESLREVAEEIALDSIVNN